MSTKTEAIMDRLHGFLKTRSDKSLLFHFVDGFGNSLRETEGDVFRILRGHWIDTAKGVDLDKLGAIFKIRRHLGEQDQPFRRRIKRAIQEYKGGGTVSAVEFALTAMFGSSAIQTEIIEFPPTSLAIEIEASSGDTWRVSSLGITDVVPKISMSIQSKGAEVRDPSIRNMATGESRGIRGTMRSGQEVVLSAEKGEIDGIDITDKVTGKSQPTILRKGSDWQYGEFLQGKIGVFDSGQFDESFFATPLPKVRIRLEWTARKASAIEIRIPRATLDKTGLGKEEIVGALNAIKASGIEMLVRIEETLPRPQATIPVVPMAHSVVQEPAETAKVGDIHA